MSEAHLFDTEMYRGCINLFFIARRGFISQQYSAILSTVFFWNSGKRSHQNFYLCMRWNICWVLLFFVIANFSSCIDL